MDFFICLLFVLRIIIITDSQFYSATLCSDNDFACLNKKQCISDLVVCDGTENCADGSDETKSTCEDFPCSDFAFRCNYGGCIDRTNKCNGKNDCADGSDETHADCIAFVPTCSPLEFTCKSGECVDIDVVCDGKTECSDYSDETKDECERMQCSDLQFRCAYGACVDRDALCNSKIQCADGSDEDARLCSLLPQTQINPELNEDFCVLPLYPTNGFYKLDSKHPGDNVKAGSIISFQCNIGYQLRPIKSQLIFCQNDTWNAKPPVCIAECPKLQSISQDIHYFNGSFELHPDEPILPGSLATLKCKHSYVKPIGNTREQLYCNAVGSWNGFVYECDALCGTEIGKARPFVINGSEANPLEFPWNVGIYETTIAKDHIHICGGTIISSRVVLTAAHCFFAENKRKSSNFSIAAGKYYSYWFATSLHGKDQHAQLREVSNGDIIIPEEYLGEETSYRSDIALLVLKRKDYFTFNDYVRPACIDWNNLSENEVLKKHSVGKVAGWGKTNETSLVSSDTLRMINVPYVTFSECIRGIPNYFKPFVIGDKICTGYQNGTSVCEGDSGSGLVFKNPVDKLYYLRGIVSIGPSRKTSLGYVCNSHTYTLYSKVSSYIAWIREHEAKNL